MACACLTQRFSRYQLHSLRYHICAYRQFLEYNSYYWRGFYGHRHSNGISSGLGCRSYNLGAYFGDKISPLSDTTVVASSACGVDLFKHIRYLMLTSIPAMGIALIVFMTAGIFTETSSQINANEVCGLLANHFNLTPFVLIIPAITLTMIALRVPTLRFSYAAQCSAWPEYLYFNPE